MFVLSQGARIFVAARLALLAAACVANDFRPVQEPLPTAPPEGAIVLFGDGGDGARGGWRHADRR